MSLPPSLHAQDRRSCNGRRVLGIEIDLSNMHLLRNDLPPPPTQPARQPACPARRPPSLPASHRPAPTHTPARSPARLIARDSAVRCTTNDATSQSNRMHDTSNRSRPPSPPTSPPIQPVHLAIVPDPRRAALPHTCALTPARLAAKPGREHVADRRGEYRDVRGIRRFFNNLAPSKFTVRHCGILGHFWPGMKAVTYRPKLFGFVRIDGRYIVWHFLLRLRM